MPRTNPVPGVTGAQMIEKANDVKRYRENLKAIVGVRPQEEGLMRASQIILRSPEFELKTLAVGTLLCWVDGIASRRSEKLLKPLGINPSAQLRSLTVRQREAVASALLEMRSR